MRVVDDARDVDLSPHAAHVDRYEVASGILDSHDAPRDC
jgi:hypothetical protein